MIRTATHRLPPARGRRGPVRGVWTCTDTDDGTLIVFMADLDMGIPTLADALEPIAVRTLIDNTQAIVGGLFGGAVSSLTTPERRRPVPRPEVPMSFLGAAATSRQLPARSRQIAEVPLDQLEQPGSGALPAFREAGGPALLVPAEFGGWGRP